MCSTTRIRSGPYNIHSTDELALGNGHGLRNNDTLLPQLGLGQPEDFDGQGALDELVGFGLDDLLVLAIDETPEIYEGGIRVVLCFEFGDVRDGLGQVAHGETYDMTACMDARVQLSLCYIDGLVNTVTDNKRSTVWGGITTQMEDLAVRSVADR